MIDLGTVRPGKTLNIPFSTYDSNDPSASVTVTALVAADIEIYKDGSLIQRASDAGYVVDVDLDGTVGVHSIQIDLADNTTVGFFSAGSEYVVAVGPMTVDAATINFVAARFTIGYSDAVINTTIATLATQVSFTLTSGPAEANALNGCVVCIHDVASAVQLGFAVISAYAVTTKTVTLTAGVSFTAATTDNISIFPPSAARWLGPVAQSGDGTELTVITTDTEAVLVDTEAATGVITDTEAILTDTEAAITERSTILTDTEAAITERSTLLTDTEAVLVDTEAVPATIATLLVDTEASRVDEAAILVDTEAAITERSTLLTDTEAILVDTEASGLTALGTGTAQSGTASTIVLAAVDSFADNVLNGNIIKIHTGTGAGQSRVILSNTLSDDTCNITPNWATNPSSDSQYEIVNGSVNITAVSNVAEDVATQTTAAAILVDTEAATGVITDTEAILTDTEAAITERTTLLTDTEASQVAETAILADTEAAITERSTLLTDTEAVLVDTEAGAVADTMEGFFQVALRSDAAITTDRSAILTLINANEGTGAGDYAATTESQEALGDTIITDTEAILVDTEAATGVITDTEAILTDTEAAITERSTILTDTEASQVAETAILADTEAAGVPPTTAQIASGVWTDTTAGDFTVALSVGKSVMNGVTLGTGLTTVSVSGAVGSVTGAVGSVTGHTNQTGDSFLLANGATGFVAIDTVVDAIKVVTDAIGATGTGLSAMPWNAAWDTEVESEVNDALDTAIAELGVAAPTATPTVRTGLMLMYMALRNKTIVQTSGTDALEIHNNAGTKIASKLLTDDGSDYTEAEMA